MTGTRRKICKVCYAAGKGVKEIGKLQRVKELLVQGMIPPTQRTYGGPTGEKKIEYRES